ncbi:MAG: polymer-forming cytoskeletal protein [Nitrospinae bacterium]|nr:polymer-forming cytoskeletal protein [Nitrospinota bacterium]
MRNPLQMVRERIRGLGKPATGTITVAPEGEVEGNVNAVKVIIGGKIKGGFYIAGKREGSFAVTAVVPGNLRCGLRVR